MKSRINSYPFSLKDISELLDLKLGYWSDRLKTEFNKKVDLATTGIITEMDKRFAEVYNRFDEVDKRFDRLEDKVQSLDERLIVQSGRLKRVEKHSFATS